MRFGKRIRIFKTYKHSFSPRRAMRVVWFFFAVCSASDDYSLMQQNLEVGKELSGSAFASRLKEINDLMQEMPFPGKMRQMALDSLMKEIAAEGRLSPEADPLLQQVLDLLGDLIGEFKHEKSIQQSILDNTNTLISGCNSYGVSADGTAKGAFENSAQAHFDCRNDAQKTAFDQSASHCYKMTYQMSRIKDGYTGKMTSAHKPVDCDPFNPAGPSNTWNTHMSGMNHRDIYVEVQDHLIAHIGHWDTNFADIKAFLDDAYKRMYECDLDGSGTLESQDCHPSVTDINNNPWNDPDTLWGHCSYYTSTLEGWIKECDRLQSTTELDYCEWRNSRTSMCSHRTDCVNNKTRDHRNLVSSIKPVADRRTHEGALLNYIVCLVGLLKQGTAEQAEITACGNQEGSTYTDTTAQSDFNVTYPSLDTADECDTSPVSLVPADAAYYTQKYQCPPPSNCVDKIDHFFPMEAPAFDDSYYTLERCEAAPSST